MSRRCRSPGVRSRAALGWGLACFAGLNLALLGVIEAGHPELRDPEFGHKRARLFERLAVETGRPLLLALGSSRMSYGFRPDVLPSLTAADGDTLLVFNFAINGSGPVMELLHLRRLVEMGIRPRWLVVEVMPIFLYNEGLNAEEVRIVISGLSLRDMLFLRRYYRDPALLTRLWCDSRLNPWHENRFAIMSRFAPAWLPSHDRMDCWAGLEPSGWRQLPWDSMSPESFRRAVLNDLQKFGPFLANYRVSDVSRRALDELLGLARHEGISVLLVLLPETSPFRSWYPAAARAEMDDFLGGLRRAWQVPIVDARDWAADWEFGDAQHLLTRGADRFTHRLAQEVLIPWIEGRCMPGRPGERTEAGGIVHAVPSP